MESDLRLEAPFPLLSQAEGGMQQLSFWISMALNQAYQKTGAFTSKTLVEKHPLDEVHNNIHNCMISVYELKVSIVYTLFLWHVDY